MLLCYGGQNKESEVGGVCGTCGEKSNPYRVVIAKSEGKRQLGRPRHRWQNNIKMDDEETG
jgi:hypothetical protein